MSSSWWDRFGALSGVGAVGLIAAHSILTDPYDPATDPNPTQPAAALAQALIRNRDDARLGAYLGLAGVFFLLWFVGYVRHYLRRAEGEEGWLASVVHGGGLLLAALVLVSVGFAFAASELTGFGDDAQVAKVFFLYGWGFAGLYMPPLGAMVAATLAVGLRHAALPRWFTCFSVLVAALLALLAVSAVGLGSLVGLLWLGALSLLLGLWPRGGVRSVDQIKVRQGCSFPSALGPLAPGNYCTVALEGAQRRKKRARDRIARSLAHSVACEPRPAASRCPAAGRLPLGGHRHPEGHQPPEDHPGPAGGSG